MSTPRRITTALLSTALVATTVPAVTATATTQQSPQQQSSGNITWQDCPHRKIWLHPGLVCAEVAVPVDHQKPDGEKTTIWVGKKAATSGKAQGTIVIAASKYDKISQATDATQSMLSADLLRDFDVISIDQRGYSHDGSARCLATGRDQDNVMSALNSLPGTRGQQLDFLHAANDFGKACRKNLSADHLASNSETYAQDLDIVRQALGQDQLTMYAAGPTNQLGQVYADMFPDKLRGMVVDGFSDHHAVQGDRNTSRLSLADRTGSVDNHYRVLRDLLKYCTTLSPDRCSLGRDGQPDAVAKLDKVFTALQQDSLMSVAQINMRDKDGNLVRSFTISREVTMKGAMAMLTRAVSQPDRRAQDATSILQRLWLDAEGLPPEPIEIAAGVSAESVKEEFEQFYDEALNTDSSPQAQQSDDSYKSELDMALITACNDARFTGSAQQAAAKLTQSPKPSRMFAATLGWPSVACHSWPRAKAGLSRSYDATTDNPLLFVTSKRSPQITHDQATKVVNRFGNAVLLTDEGWGSRRYGNNSCVTSAIDAYLRDPAKPTKLSCKPDKDLFESLKDRPLPIAQQ